MMLTIAPDLQSLLRKGELRLAGAGLAVLYSVCALLLLMRQPYFSQLATLLFLGMFLAGYLARASVRWSYAGLQMGLVLPMIMVVPVSECGELWGAVSRVLGVAIAVFCSVLVTGLAYLIRPLPPEPTPTS
jgi:uncharacterized membrane protein YccC